ncbi:MAG: recombination regulator RecX, partial [Gammaproteobacteria bacterium]|nr:recombination regulator RecX [Gammaproteobacteria bacterium]
MPDEILLKDSTNAYNTAVRLLSRREHSCLELRRKLKIRGINQDIIDETISLLTRDGLLSNERFTESYVRVRINK